MVSDTWGARRRWFRRGARRHRLFLFPFTTSFIALALNCALMGVASGFALGSMTVYTYDIVPASARGRLQSLRRVIGQTAGTFGPILGGIVATTSSPRMVFWVFAPVLVTSAVLIGLFARESAGKHAHPWPVSMNQSSAKREMLPAGKCCCPALYGHRRKYDKVSRAYFQEVYSVLSGKTKANVPPQIWKKSWWKLPDSPWGRLREPELTAAGFFLPRCKIIRCPLRGPDYEDSALKALSPSSAKRRAAGLRISRGSILVRVSPPASC